MSAPAMKARGRWALLALLVAILTALTVVAKIFTRRSTDGAPPMLTVVQALGPGPHDDTFARAVAPREFHFPADHGPHPEFRNEWWYWTGNLATSSGRAFGFELTIFRTALAPEPDPERGSAWAPRDIYMAHFTVTDVAGEHFYAYERTSRGALDLAGAKVAPFRTWVLDWSATGPDDPNKALPFRLRAADGGVSIDLTLEQGKPTVLEGDHGLSKKGPEPGNASYYYSLTRMPTSGAIAVGGERFDVHGDSWMDREWSTRALSSDQIGWNWFALRLDDGRELMFFHLRRRDGQTDPWSSGTLVNRDGTTLPLRADDVILQPIGTWRSSRSHTEYPAAFHIAVPSAALDLRVIPLLSDQELDLTFRYWEGAIRIEGSAGNAPAKGLGYLELTGYGEESRRPH